MDTISLLDVFSTYLYGLKYIAMAVALWLLLSGIDDLFIDLVYWSRRCWRSLTVYRRHPHMEAQDLRFAPERAMAIMVPAWQETGVIGQMAGLAAKTLDYENYHIFVGTYPNDPETQLEVDAVCARFPNVHKVICARPGPTSKADCLNNIVDAIFQFEQRAKLEFAGFVLYDAEDVLSDMELRLFNHLVERKDLIQIPVYPSERRWTHFTSMHYMDEFAELHGKDLTVREALAGQVPSAGVGTCFSRRALLALLADGDGIAFDIQSLTEDYDIGFRLKARGMSEIFVRFPTVRDRERDDDLPFGASARTASMVCVREFFPDRVSTAVRQKSRWIIGIVYQGYKTLRWTSSPVLNYFLWRDRKGAVNNFVSFAAMVIFLQLVALWLLELMWADAPSFLSIFAGDPWFRLLLLVNLALMTNRIFQRMLFVTGFYGLWQGVMSVPRIFWGNVINFLANCRAMAQVIAHGDPRRVAWDKTTHDFPSIGEPERARLPLGQILIDQGALDEAALVEALARRMRGLRLGGSLVHRGVISPAQLARAIAFQAGSVDEDIEPYEPAPELLDRISSELALRYAVLPLRVEGSKLVLASESAVDPVTAAALARHLECPVGFVVAHRGQVTVGLRKYMSEVPERDPGLTLQAAVERGWLDPQQATVVWHSFVSRQVALGEILICLGHVDAAAFRALMLRHGHGERLGEFLVGQGVIDSATLREALVLQDQLQPTVDQLLAGWASRLQSQRSQTGEVP